MKIVFMGTPEFAVLPLRGLVENGYQVAAIVTQPDRPKGRKRILTPPSVKLEGEKFGIPVYQPEKLRGSETEEALNRLQPDLIVTAAFGQLLPKSILDLPRFGCVNVHASLLPKYRGGAPIQRAIMNGEKVTGVTLMFMSEAMDAGDIIRQVEVPIGDEDDSGTMHDKLSRAGTELLLQTLPDLFKGRIRPVRQNEAEVSYAPNLTREDERLDWARSSRELFNQIRALRPWPGAYTLLNGQVLKVWSCQKPNGDERQAAKPELAPGTVRRIHPDSIEVQTGDGVLHLTVVQPAGKKAMPVSEFVRGVRILEGTILGE